MTWTPFSGCRTSWAVPGDTSLPHPTRSKRGVTGQLSAPSSDRTVDVECTVGCRMTDLVPEDPSVLAGTTSMHFFFFFGTSLFFF